MAIAARIAAAERPLILAGFEAARANADLTALGIPVLTTYKAKGIIPEDHPLSLGAILAQSYRRPPPTLSRWT